MNQIKFYPDLLTGRLSENDAKRYFARFGWFAFSFYVILSVAQSAIAMAVRTLAPSLIEKFWFLELFSVIPMYAVAFPLAFLIIAPLPTVKPVKEKMSFKDLIVAFCICEAFMTIGNYISSIFLTAFQSAMGGGVPTNPLAESIERQPMWATILFTAILAPVLEEIFFRGFVCKKLLVLGEGYAVVLSAAFFALCHGNFFQLFYAFIVGVFFGFIYVKTGKLIYTTVLHILVNFLGSVVVTYVMDLVDIEQLLSENFMLSSENILGVLALLAYEFFVFGISVFGIVMLVKNKSRVKFDTGLLPPPEGGRGISCVFLNSGIAAAIAVFSLVFLSSLFL